ncbi:MAG: hypothetical protein AVDCRST_MAG83-658, partial [uncultured Arthrobacter sp.]
GIPAYGTPTRARALALAGGRHRRDHPLRGFRPQHPRARPECCGNRGDGCALRRRLRRGLDGPARLADAASPVADGCRNLDHHGGRRPAAAVPHRGRCGPELPGGHARGAGTAAAHTAAAGGRRRAGPRACPLRPRKPGGTV